MFRFTALFTLCLACTLPFAAGCAGDAASKEETAPKTEAAKTPAKTEAPEAEAPKAEAAKTYDVACGCTIEAVGHCGEYAIVDGRHVEIKDHGLGSMPFCGKSGQKAKIAGEIKGDALHATSVEVLK